MKSKITKFSMMLVCIATTIMFWCSSAQSSTTYDSTCYSNCKEKDVTKSLGSSSNIWKLNNNKYEDLVLSYSSLLSKSGSFELSGTYTDANGEKIRLSGKSFDVEDSEIYWPMFGDAKITFKDGKIFLTGDEKIFKSTQEEFINKVDKAAYMLTIYASNHDDDLKPVKLLDGSEVVKKR